MSSWIFVEYKFDKRADLLRIDLPSLEHLQQPKMTYVRSLFYFLALLFHYILA